MKTIVNACSMFFLLCCVSCNEPSKQADVHKDNPPSIQKTDSATAMPIVKPDTAHQSPMPVVETPANIQPK